MIQIDKHHLVLYGLLFVLLVVLAGVFHEWRMDVQKASLTQAVEQRAAADREKQLETTVDAIKALKVTPGTPPAKIVERIPQLITFPGKLQLEPEMRDVGGNLVPPKPDAPKVNLVLDPAQQVTLVNRLADCKICEADRDKLKGDLAGMTKERDGWRDAAKGGSLWTRVKRRAWHFLEDAIIIEGARCASGHC